MFSLHVNARMFPAAGRPSAARRQRTGLETKGIGMSELKDKHKDNSRNTASFDVLEVSGIVDSHNHCKEFSPDASQTLDALIAEGRAKGLGGLALTDHYDKDMINSKLHRELSAPGSLPAEGEWIFDIDAYFKAVSTKQAELQEEGSPFQLYSGLELGYQDYLTDSYRDLVAKYPFDVVIGSLHSMMGFDVYSFRALYERPKQEAYALYLDGLRAMTETLDFDICGHFDYVSRYASYEDNRMLYDEHKEAFDRFLEAVVRHGKCLEINTAGFRSIKDPAGQPAGHPDSAILQRYLELGGTKVCLSSDAHHPGRSAQHFNEAAAWLKELGFTALTYYEQREARFTPL